MKASKKGLASLALLQTGGCDCLDNGDEIFGAVLQLPRKQVMPLEHLPRLVLPTTRAQGRASDADQRGRMKWPLKKTYVAEKLLQSIGQCTAARRISVTGEDDDRKIRPGWLGPDPLRQACEIRCRNGLFDNH